LKSNIFSELRYWQEIFRRESVKFGADLEHIINSAGVKIISLYRDRLIFGFLPSQVGFENTQFYF